jgi:hypothetical protein
MSQHILLRIENPEGRPLKEPVHVENLGDDMFRLLYSPGLVLGIAAGDEFRLLGDDGAFEVTRRGGNLAIQVYCTSSVPPHQAELEERVAQLGGTLDGSIDRGLAFTIPVTAGFAAIEAIFNTWVASHEGWDWYYGNVYDPVDGITPLCWWIRDIS